MTDEQRLLDEDEDFSALKGLLIGVALGSAVWIILGLVAWWVLSK